MHRLTIRGHDQAESLIDELIRAILAQAGGSPEATAPGKASAASLLEIALASTLASPSSSALERYLIAQAFASAVAEALAPRLAELLAPRLMEHIERVMASEPSGRGRASSGGSGRRAEGR